MTIHPYPDNPVVLPLWTPEGDLHSEAGSNRFLYLGFWDSVATACGMFHMLGSSLWKSSQVSQTADEVSDSPTLTLTWDSIDNRGMVFSG